MYVNSYNNYKYHSYYKMIIYCTFYINASNYAYINYLYIINI